VTQSAKVFHSVKAIKAVIALLSPRRMQALIETTIVINIHRWGGYCGSFAQSKENASFD